MQKKHMNHYLYKVSHHGEILSNNFLMYFMIQLKGKTCVVYRKKIKIALWKIQCGVHDNNYGKMVEPTLHTIF